MHSVDPRALREQLHLGERVSEQSPDFLRFVIRLSEELNVDIPKADRGQLLTLAGCVKYVSAHGTEARLTPSRAQTPRE
jgi:hypothetical protein